MSVVAFASYIPWESDYHKINTRYRPATTFQIYCLWCIDQQNRVNFECVTIGAPFPMNHCRSHGRQAIFYYYDTVDNQFLEYHHWPTL